MLFEESLALVKEELEAVEAALQENFMSDVVIIPQISKYLAEGGGKRIRPLLLLTSSKLCGYNNGNRHVGICCVVEFIHSATLLHDDVVDGADLRRGKPAANIKWGNEASVLVGDYLFSKSFQLVAQDRDFKILSTISEASSRLIEGEVLQLTQRNDILTTEEEYYNMIKRKTAALMASSCQAGAILGNSPVEVEEALFLFGEKIGMAFQMVDDLLDYFADDEKLGKTAHNDLREGHVTLPLIYLYSCSDKEEKEFVNGVLGAEELSREDGLRVIELMEKYDVVKYAMEKATAYIQQGKKAIENLPQSKYLNSLNSIADFIIESRVEFCMKNSVQ